MEMSKEETMERRIDDIEYEQMLLSRYTVAQHRGADGLERSVYLLLGRIRAQGPMSISQLSTLFRLDVSTLQRQTTAALKAGLLTRIADPDGGVARKFALTEAGARRLEDVRTRSVRALDRILEDWPTEDVNRFAELLHRFNTSIEEYSAHARTSS
jgi:DNA-binding MarR family transcriptional regulator